MAKMFQAVKTVLTFRPGCGDYCWILYHEL